MIRYNAINNNFQTIGNMKKNILSAATILAATLAFTACQKNDDLGDGLRRQVDISATIEGHTQTRAQLAENGSGTFENGDVLSLFYASTQKQPSDPDFKMPVIMDYTISSTKLYWEDVKKNSSPTTDNKYGFLAWYPKYAISIGEFSEKKGKFDYDVAGAADDVHRDFLVAEPTKVAYGKPVNLTFRHVMHKLTVTLKSNVLTDAQLGKAEVKLMGFKSHAKVNIGLQTSIEKEASGTDEYPTKKGTSVSFIVAPQNLRTGERMLSIGVEGKTFFFAVPDKLPGCKDDAPCCLMSGKHLTLNLSLSIGQGGNTVTLIEGSISAWDEQGCLDGTIDDGGGASAEQFPDPNFKAYVLEKFDKDKNGKISTAEAEAVTKIDVNGKEIVDLTGIELFTKLEKLECHKNQLTELNISGCTHLKKLQCYNNQLEKLDVSKNTGLETLSCHNNKLTKLEVSANTALKLLYCYDNALTSLEVSKNTSLETLSCHNNEIATLNVSGCTPLKALFCYNNKLTTLNVGATKVLEKLMCGIQKEDRQLTLTLGNARNRDKWKTEWRFSPENQRVTVADEN